VSPPGDYPSIADYAFIGDCHASALVARDGSIDWCCLPRMDVGSCFGRLLDRRQGGFCSIAPTQSRRSPARRYLDDTLVLETTHATRGAQARVLDLVPVHARNPARPLNQLLRIIEGDRGTLELVVRIEPRFDYGLSTPLVRQERTGVFTAMAGNDALVISGDLELEFDGHDRLVARHHIRAGERVRLSLVWTPPEEVDRGPVEPVQPEEIDRRVDQTIAWWRKWARRTRFDGPDLAGITRSAIVLKALTNAPTGAIAAAATTSLPESPTGGRTWDYRFSWVRDSTYSARCLADLGHEAEADEFRAFIQRSAAGSVDDLQIVYGIGGERRMPAVEIPELEGWRGRGPVRVGNDAATQMQNDVYGELLNLAWRWHQRGHSPDDDLWRFLVALVDRAAECWLQPDRGMWEWQGRPQHFVHSKAMCWSALDRGIALADDSQRRAPVRRWGAMRKKIRNAIERHGYDRKRGIFVQTFDGRELDAALLLLPVVEFVAWDDERMVRTADAVRDKLDDDGLLRRYRRADGLKGREGAFLAAGFWLAECLAWQGRTQEARAVFDRSTAAGNDLGLFSEEFDTTAGEPAGNFPQALTHLAQIGAALALNACQAADSARSGPGQSGN